MADTYSVQSGDTLSGIYKDLGYSSWQDLYTANKTTIGSNPSLIYPGQKLTYYKAPATTSTGTTTTSTVKAPSAIPDAVKPVAKPASSSEVLPYLQNYQKALKSAREALKSPFAGMTDEQIKQRIEEEITPEGGLPDVPDMTDLFQQMREDYGVMSLEKQVNDLKAMEDEAYARLRERKMYEESQPARLGVIAGRQTEIQRQEQENIDFISRQIQRNVDQLNTAYGVIDTMMNLTQMDYDNAVRRYETEFNQKMQIYDMFRQEKADIRQTKMDRLSLEMQNVQKKEEQARANLEIYTNLMMEGNLDYKSASPQMKLKLDQLAIKSGLGKSFFKNIKFQDKILMTNTRTGPDGMVYADVIRQDSNGRLYTESVSTGRQYMASRSSGGSGGRSSSSSFKITTSMINDAVSFLQDQDLRVAERWKDEFGEAKPDNIVSGREYEEAFDYIMGTQGVYDEAMAYEILKKAYSKGGYRQWEDQHGEIYDWRGDNKVYIDASSGRLYEIRNGKKVFVS